MEHGVRKRAVGSRQLTGLTQHLVSTSSDLKLDQQIHSDETRKGGLEAALFSSVARVNLYFGVDPLFENELLVLLEFITVLQALVFILTDHLAA